MSTCKFTGLDVIIRCITLGQSSQPTILGQRGQPTVLGQGSTHCYKMAPSMYKQACSKKACWYCTQKSSIILSQPFSISMSPASLSPVATIGFSFVTKWISLSFTNPNKLQALRQRIAQVLSAFKQFWTWGRHKHPHEKTCSTSVDMAVQ